jgi:hypothetical protein
MGLGYWCYAGRLRLWCPPPFFIDLDPQLSDRRSVEHTLIRRSHLQTGKPLTPRLILSMGGKMDPNFLSACIANSHGESFQSTCSPRSWGRCVLQLLSMEITSPPSTSTKAGPEYVLLDWRTRQPVSSAHTPLLSCPAQVNSSLNSLLPLSSCFASTPFKTTAILELVT